MATVPCKVSSKYFRIFFSGSSFPTLDDDKREKEERNLRTQELQRIGRIERSTKSLLRLSETNL